MNTYFPKITIITATYNLIKGGREGFFRQCVESVHNQTYPNIEHIVMDGASTDGSLDLIREYEEKGWLKCYSEPDNGIDDAYDHALKHVTGKYVFFMNSDDRYFADNVLEECVRQLEENEADYCYGEEKRFDRDGNFVSHWEPHSELFWFTMPFSHQTMGVKTDVIKKIDRCDDGSSYGGDFSLILSLIVGDYKGVYVRKVISYYRMGGISSRPNDLAQQMQTVYTIAKKMMAFSKNFYEDITLDQCIYILMNLKQNGKKCFPKYYLERLVRFMVEKKLKNFNYNTFISLVQSYLVYEETEIQDLEVKNTQQICRAPASSSAKKIYFRLFFFLPILTLRRKEGALYIKVLGFIPLIKIKRK